MNCCASKHKVTAVKDICSVTLVFFHTTAWLVSIKHASVFQAGDLYEKMRNNERALDYYCKGGAFRKGESVTNASQQNLDR